MPSTPDASTPEGASPGAVSDLLPDQPTPRDELVESLQQSLEDERDARSEDRFVFIVVIVLLLDVVFFSVMPSFGGPLALLVLELLILIPLAKRMGMQEVAKLLDRVLSRMISPSKAD